GNRPGIIAVPIRTRTETGTLVFSSLVSLTPGSLSLDLSEDGETLFVHAMFVDDPDGIRADMRKLEDPVLEAVE
ncbi:MAG: Na+/H+ antiporter subunit E, partial [Pseudomonadota bacterium]